MAVEVEKENGTTLMMDLWINRTCTFPLDDGIYAVTLGRDKCHLFTSCFAQNTYDILLHLSASW